MSESRGTRRRLKLPTPRTCAKYSLEAARNAEALREVAESAAGLGRYGAAVALEVLALEEAAKAQALGMRAMVATLDISYPTKGLEDVLQLDHTTRHRFALWQITMRELVRLSQDRLTGGVALLDAVGSVAGQKRWLDKANAWKENGFYVDPHSGKTPAEVSKADYDQAVTIVEPYVNLTLEQAGLRPPPEAPRHRLVARPPTAGDE